MHWAAAILTLAFYLTQIPLKVAVVWKGLGAGAAVSAFEGRFALRRAEKKRARREKGGGGGISARTALRLLRSCSLEEFSASLRVGTGDAAATALLCGGLRALCETLRAFAERGQIRVEPDFAAPRFEAEGRALISIRTGEALLALAGISRRGHGKPPRVR